LAAWANAKDDMSTRNSEGNLSAEVGLDHRKREIHTGGYACGRPDAPILNMYRVTIDDHGRTKAF